MTNISYRRDTASQSSSRRCISNLAVLEALMARHRLTVRDVAALAVASEADVAAWCDGITQIPDRAIDMLELRLQLGQRRT